MLVLEQGILLYSALVAIKLFWCVSSDPVIFCAVGFIFEQTIELDGKVLFDRAAEGRFPEVKEIKQSIRDKLAPDMDLGHSDIKEIEKTISDELSSESMSDEEAEEQRRFFGVN